MNAEVKWWVNFAADSLAILGFLFVLFSLPAPHVEVYLNDPADNINEFFVSPFYLYALSRYQLIKCRQFMDIKLHAYGGGYSLKLSSLVVSLLTVKQQLLIRFTSIIPSFVEVISSVLITVLAGHGFCMR